MCFSGSRRQTCQGWDDHDRLGGQSDDMRRVAEELAIGGPYTTKSNTRTALLAQIVVERWFLVLDFGPY